MRVAARSPIVERRHGDEESGRERGRKTGAEDDRAALGRGAGDRPVEGHESGDHGHEEMHFDADGGGEREADAGERHGRRWTLPPQKRDGAEEDQTELQVVVVD